jgi:hypothetical protein
MVSLKRVCPQNTETSAPRPNTLLETSDGRTPFAAGLFIRVKNASPL